MKLVVIGGGSSYTPELIEGVIDHHRTLPIMEVVLVDIEEGKRKLQINTEFAKRMVKKAGHEIEVKGTLGQARCVTRRGLYHYADKSRRTGCKVARREDSFEIRNDWSGNSQGLAAVLRRCARFPCYWTSAKISRNYVRRHGSLTLRILRES